jgi:hypothetical protein
MKIHKAGREQAPPIPKHWLVRQYDCPNCRCHFELEESDVGQGCANEHPDHGDSIARASVVCPHCLGILPVEWHQDHPGNEHLTARHAELPHLIVIAGPGA